MSGRKPLVGGGKGSDTATSPCRIDATEGNFSHFRAPQRVKRLINRPIARANHGFKRDLSLGTSPPPYAFRAKKAKKLAEYARGGGVEGEAEAKKCTVNQPAHAPQFASENKSGHRKDARAKSEKPEPSGLEPVEVDVIDIVEHLVDFIGGIRKAVSLELDAEYLAIEVLDMGLKQLIAGMGVDRIEERSKSCGLKR